MDELVTECVVQLITDFLICISITTLQNRSRESIDGGPFLHIYEYSFSAADYRIPNSSLLHVIFHHYHHYNLQVSHIGNIAGTFLKDFS